MNFVSLTIQNYKVFYGKQTIFFNHYQKNNTDSSSIILIGGLNGSGKTTILSAVQIVLFGQGNYSNSEFRKMMNGTLNNKYLEENGNTAKLSLTIESDQKLYTINATLYYNANNEFSYMERKMVLPNKTMNLTENEIQIFINKNIPQEASLFFLFDGEKIQEIVDHQEEKSLKRSIQNIVSLEFYKNTLNDVQKIKNKIDKQLIHQVSKSQISNLQIDKEQLEKNLNETEKKLKYFQKKFKDIEEQLEKIKKIKQKKMSLILNSKNNLEKKQNELENTLNQIQKELEKYAESSLPLLILYPIIKEIQNRIKKEDKFRLKKQQYNLFFKQFDEFMIDFLDQITFLRLNDEQKKYLFKLGKKLWARHNDFFLDDVPDLEILHDLSEKEKQTLLFINPSKLIVYSLIEKKNKIKQQLEDIKTKIQNAPETVDLTEEDNKIEELNKSMGEYSLRIRSLQSKIIKIKSDLDKVNMKISEVTKRMAINSKLKIQSELVTKVYEALKEFVEQLTIFKATKIKEDFEYIISKLLRKTDDFSKIEFDLQTYKILIYDHKGTLVQLKNRSAGEKQIIALSLIWALTKNASIDLPYIIDTPLGRLDSIHRRNLIKYFFPKLSNQVIILSTDTEVNKEFNEEMLKYVKKSYRLDYDNKTKCTYIKEGYFQFE